MQVLLEYLSLLHTFKLDTELKTNSHKNIKCIFGLKKKFFLYWEDLSTITFGGRSALFLVNGQKSFSPSLSVLNLVMKFVQRGMGQGLSLLNVLSLNCTLLSFERDLLTGAWVGVIYWCNRFKGLILYHLWLFEHYLIHCVSFNSWTTKRVLFIFKKLTIKKIFFFLRNYFK